MFIKRYLLVSGVLALSGCSYITDGAIQDITLETPGAHDAVCYVYVEGLRYKVNPPQTINISKSDEDLFIDCLAPGNRRRKVYIRAGEADSFAGNIIGGTIPGGVWDYASSAMYAYPSVIEINFVGILPKAEELPAQNNPDVKQPEDYYLEEFSPARPRLNRDRHVPTTEIKRRVRSDSSSLGSGYAAKGSSGGFVDDSNIDYGPPSGGGKEDLMNIIDSLGDNMNPAQGDASDSESSDTAPQYPGE